MPVKANKTETFLLQKKWNRETAGEAAKILSNEFNPLSDARASSEGRNLMAANLLLKFWNETSNQGGENE